MEATSGNTNIKIEDANGRNTSHPPPQQISRGWNSTMEQEYLEMADLILGGYDEYNNGIVGSSTTPPIVSSTFKASSCNNCDKISEEHQQYKSLVEELSQENVQYKNFVEETSQENQQLKNALKATQDKLTIKEQDLAKYMKYCLLMRNALKVAQTHIRKQNEDITSLKTKLSNVEDLSGNNESILHKLLQLQQPTGEVQLVQESKGEQTLSDSQQYILPSTPPDNVNGDDGGVPSVEVLDIAEDDSSDLEIIAVVGGSPSPQQQQQVVVPSESQQTPPPPPPAPVGKTHGIDKSKNGHFCMCGAKYKTAAARNLHVFVKMGGKNLQCLVCGKRFITVTHLTYHKMLVHDLMVTIKEPKEFRCRLCLQGFQSQHQFCVHYRHLHSTVTEEGI